MPDKKISAEQISKKLKRLADKKVADQSRKYFKTADGEYAEAERFLGLRTPVLRDIAKQHWDMALTEVSKLLRSSYHEQRILAIYILVTRYKKANEVEKKRVYEYYRKHIKYINNWALVDSSAEYIVGDYLLERDRDVLYKWLHSSNLWHRRIAVMATFRFIRHEQYIDTLNMAEHLLTDEEDLIHKAVGWMLREIGKRNLSVEEKFLKKHCRAMPRTMLRYAIEKFPENKRQSYLKGEPR